MQESQEALEQNREVSESEIVQEDEEVAPVIEEIVSDVNEQSNEIVDAAQDETMQEDMNE